MTRVAAPRHGSSGRVRELVEQATEGRTFGILGEPRVNVLELNLRSDAQSAAQMNEARPDPDQLLATVKAEEARARRGKLRIFFGASAGVGKTYSMLEAARGVRASRRRHRRRLCRAARTHRDRAAARRAGAAADAGRALSRHRPAASSISMPRSSAGPAILIVDELAHSNLIEGDPPPRHAKRWQDIEELLGAGHQRLDDGQRPAPGEPQRSRRADHGRAAARDHPRPHLR